MKYKRVTIWRNRIYRWRKRIIEVLNALLKLNLTVPITETALLDWFELFHSCMHRQDIQRLLLTYITVFCSTAENPQMAPVAYCTLVLHTQAKCKWRSHEFWTKNIKSTRQLTVFLVPCINVP